MSLYNTYVGSALFFVLHPSTELDLRESIQSFLYRYQIGIDVKLRETPSTQCLLQYHQPTIHIHAIINTFHKSAYKK